MAYTRDDFYNAIANEVSSKPLAAQYYQAGDPRLLAQMGAMATMLAMVSQQLDVESMEPFNKSRDTTVLADATMKGILPFARPARVTVAVENKDAGPLSIAIGRRFIGAQGLVYVAETAATIAGGASGTFTAKQLTNRVFQHTVFNSVPFYSVQIPASTDAEQFISGVRVSVADVSYAYTPEFANLAANDPGFTMETDEYRRLFAKFGWQDVFGIQPANGTVIDFVIEETAGESSLPVNSPFSFETAATAADQMAKLTLASVIHPGSNPLDIQTLRELAQYPSVFDESAVYLGNFDFNIRRNLAGLRFLSVWNEKIEETVRGASVNNINRLFISALMDEVTTEWLQGEITRIVTAADDSYHIQFVTANPVEPLLTVNAQVGVVHDPAEVTSKIKGAVLALYGADSSAAKRGMLSLNHKRIYDAIRSNVAALQSPDSDFQVVIPAPLVSVKPEDYRYLTADSITVNVTQSTYNDGLWSH